MNALTERRDAREASGQDAVLRQQQQMAAIVARKKDATWQKLEELNARRSEVAQELGQKQAAAASVRCHVAQSDWMTGCTGGSSRLYEGL